MQPGQKGGCADFIVIYYLLGTVVCIWFPGYTQVCMSLEICLSIVKTYNPEQIVEIAMIIVRQITVAIRKSFISRDLFGFPHPLVSVGKTLCFLTGQTCILPMVNSACGEMGGVIHSG